jgi:H/ACA ribonucleoprotein complex subunit 3
VITAVIDGQPYRFDEEDKRLLVGSGGEADVFRFFANADFTRRYGSGLCVLKIFRKAQNDAQRRAARERQAKLQAFPRGLPRNVVAPITLAYDESGQVIGYVMAFVPDGTPLIEYKKAKFCRDHGVTPEVILRIMTNLHDLVTALHALGITIGDFNDKNVLVTPSHEVYVLDADSFQYGRWECPAFVPTFVDPKIVRLRDDRPVFRKIGQHEPTTDWYAFTVMLFQLLIRVHPYTGGFYTAAPGEGPVRDLKRIELRLGAFHPKVKLPSIATPFESVPDGIVQCFRLVFEKEMRGVFPKQLLQTTRQGPPRSTPAAPTAHPVPPPRPQAPPLPPRRPQATSNPAMRLLSVSLQGGQPRYVYHESGSYRREGGRVVCSAPTHDARLSAFPAGDRTVLASLPSSSFAIFDGAGRNSGMVQTQTQFDRVTVAANGQHVYWIRGSELVRDDRRGGAVPIGKVAANSTSVWVGERFGVALVQAGVLTKVLTFNASGAGFHDLTLPPNFGTVIDASCVVGDDLAWLVLSTQLSGRVVNQCFVLNSQAQLQATAEATKDDGTWLGSMTSAAHATGNKLLVPVPRVGIVRVGITGQQARPEITYPGTSALVPNKDATVGLTYSSAGVLHYSTNSTTPAATSL